MSSAIGMYITASLDSVLASSAVNRGFEPRSDQTKDYEIGIHCFPLSTHLSVERAKSGGSGIRIMWLIGVTCASVISVS